jgi:hypothetical protein
MESAIQASVLHRLASLRSLETRTDATLLRTAVALTFGLLVSQALADEKRPNIVLILADDK